MAFNPALLNDGETVVVHTRTHAKALLLPLLVLIVVLAIAGFLSRLPGGAHRGTWLLVTWVVALAVILVFAGWPWLNWLVATYTVTTRRLITRSGVITRRGHDIPLSRISDVSTERGVIDRMLGCGTLVVADASDRAVRLHDIPHVEQVTLKLSDLVFDHGNRHDDGT